MENSIFSLPVKRKHENDNFQQVNGTKSEKKQYTVHEKTLQVGSRKSQLALFQTNFVVNLLRNQHSSISYSIVSMTTTGDKILDVALSKIGQKSLFTKELEVALERKEVHMVVHSLKDLPTALPPGMVIGAICKRENPHDVVVFPDGVEPTPLKSLPDGSVIGTSSLRRIAQLSRLYPHLKFESIRGNLNTRLRKLDEDKTYDALVLAAAGLIRLDLEHRIGKVLPPEECLYAVGQGALAIECRADDGPTLRLLSAIADAETTLRCVAERAFMRALEGGCSVPVAVHSSVREEQLVLKGGVFSLDGSKFIIEEMSCKICKVKTEINSQETQSYAGIVAMHLLQSDLKAAETLGKDLATLFLAKGAEEILKEARQTAQAKE